MLDFNTNNNRNTELNMTTTSETEVHLQPDDKSIELVGLRLAKYGAVHSLDTFLTSIAGAWTLRPANSDVFRYVVNRFSGDVVWFDRSWIASGTAIWKTLNNGHESPATWSVDYDQTTDTINWVCGGYSSSFPGVSNANSPIQHRVSVPEKKLIVVVRSDVLLGGLLLLAGSNLAVQ